MNSRFGALRFSSGSKRRKAERFASAGLPQSAVLSVVQGSAEDEIARNVELWQRLTGKTWTDDHEPLHQRSSLPWERKNAFEHLLWAQDEEPEMDFATRRKLQGRS